MSGDLISREAAIKEITALIDIEYGYEGIEDDVRRIFDNLPAVDAEPVRRGTWVELHEDYVMCSECGRIQIGKTNYCSDCGAKMEVQQND